MTHGNDPIVFELPSDYLRVRAESLSRSPGEGLPTWKVIFSSVVDDRDLLGVYVHRWQDGNGGMSFHSPTVLEGGPANPRAQRLVHAAVHLGATMAESTDHQVVVDYNTEDEWHPTAYAILGGMGFRPGKGDRTREGLPPLAVRANAGLVRLVLGPSFPPDFSLSPAETES